MSPYCMYCTVCKDNFNSLLEWNVHLPEINHQRRAQLQCRKWNVFNKECVLVVFGSCPVVDCGLIQLFSSGIGGSFVTDFIHWKKKPNIGLIQFESSESVDEALRKTGPEIWIDGTYRVQLRKAVEYYDLEWSFLFSLNAASNLELSSFIDEELTQNTTANTIKKEKGTKKRKARRLTTNENPEVNAKKKKRTKSNGEKDGSAENKEAREECRTNNDETISKKTKKKKAKAPSKSTEENPIIPEKSKKVKALEKNSADLPKHVEQQIKSNLASQNEDEAPPQSGTENACYATPAVAQSICEEANTALETETPDQANSEVLSEPEPELTEEREALDEDLIDQPISPVPEISSDEMQSAISIGARYSLNNVDQSDTNSTEVVILSSDESDEENNIVMEEENLEDDIEQQNKENYDNNTEQDNSILGSFRKEYTSLLQDILIPNDEYKNACKLIEMLESEFRKTVPECKVIPFRHWHLGIKSAGTNELLLFLDYLGIWGKEKEEWNDTTYDPIKPLVIIKFLQKPELIFSGIQKVSKNQNQNKKSTNPNEESFGVEFLYVPTGLKFRVISSPLLVHEVQTCRLIQYLCKFDPIVLPLLGLINYWANVNSLMFGNLRVTDPSKTHVSPFPAYLNWLVLLYLMRKNLIPSCRKILTKPHKNIICRGRDLGFSDDPIYPQTWSGLDMKPLQIPAGIR